MLSSFKVKLVAYFALLSLVPMAAAFWGFTTVAGTSRTRQVDARLQSGLRAALAAYEDRLDAAGTEAEALARLRSFQVALERRDRLELRRLLRETSVISVSASGGFRVGQPPEPAVLRSVDVVAAEGPIGTVSVAVPLDQALVASLRGGAGLAPEDSLALVLRGRIVASRPAVRGRVALLPGLTRTERVGGTRYRVLLAPALPGATDARLAVLSPQALIDAADATTRDRLLLGLLACLALVALAAYLEGRSIVRALRRFAEAANAIARGRLDERVAVKGRDEFARLGLAFNEMAEQLEWERAQLAGALARFGDALAATHDEQQLLHVVAEAAMAATGARGVRLTTIVGRVELGEPGAGSDRIRLPLTVASEKLGRLELAGDAFDREQRSVATSLASHAAVALENARLHGIVERQALVDGLTGVANRRQCEQALYAEVARAERLGTPLSLVLADLDDFKAVNDAHGHAAGDDVLRRFAGVLRDTVRESDVAGRWGGEEFILLLPGTDAAGAAHLADRLRLAFAEQPLDVDHGPLRVTASFGVVEHRPGVAADELVAAADRGLYRAKQEGKDRVEVESVIRSFY